MAMTIHMAAPTCSSSVWKDLYSAADAFRETACWEWMYDSDIFGVQNPRNGEIGYCCVLGAAGEVIGLVVYLGSAGLEQFHSMQSGKVRVDSPEMAYNQMCLTAWFGSRRDLDRLDLKVIKDLGLKYRGDTWPMFRSMQPSYLPWYLSEEEAKFLTLCLMRAREVAQSFHGNPEYLTPRARNVYLVKTPVQKADQPAAQPPDVGLPPAQPSLFTEPLAAPASEWEDRWIKPAPSVKTAVNPFPLDEIRLQRIKKNSRETGGVWEIDSFVLPASVEEGDRPYFPHVLLCVDKDSGFIFGTTLAKPREWEVEFPKAFLESLESNKLLPATLAFQKDELRELFTPLACQLGIEVEIAKKLPAVDHAKREMSKFMMRRR
jgi:hypothetical protein